MTKTSLSFVVGQGYLNHNMRTFLNENVDPSRTNENIYLRTKTVEETYDEIFQSAVDEYNEKQKRKDRKKSVKGYLEEIEKSKNEHKQEKPFYELVLQVGNKDTCGCVDHPENAAKAKEVLLAYFNEWEERNPNLIAFNVSLHMDEATPHMHIDYIPVARGYKKGLQVRNSLTKALEQQGLGQGTSQYDNNSQRWRKREVERLTEIAHEHGFTIEEVGANRKHLTVKEYKRMVINAVERMNQNKAALEDISSRTRILGFKRLTDDDLKVIEESLKEKDTVESLLQAVEDEHDKAMERIKEQEKKATDYAMKKESDAKEIEEKLVTLQAEIEKTAQEKKSYEKKRSDLSLQLERQQQTITVQAAELDAISKELEKADLDRQKMSSELAILQQAAERANAATLKAQELDRQLKSAKQEKEKYQKQLEKQAETIQQEKEAYAKELQDKLDTVQFENEELAKRLESQQKTINSKRDELWDTEKKLKEANTANAELAEKLETEKEKAHKQGYEEGHYEGMKKVILAHQIPLVKKDNVISDPVTDFKPKEGNRKFKVYSEALYQKLQEMVKAARMKFSKENEKKQGLSL